MLRRFFIAAVFLSMIGCKSEGKVDPKVENLGRAAGPVEPRPPSAMGMDRRAAPEDMGEQVVISGKVLETIDASRYTYVRLQGKDAKEIWAAIPQIKLEIGREVEVLQSLVMKDFESKTLGRVFPSVVFGVLMGPSPHAAGGPLWGRGGARGGRGGMGGLGAEGGKGNGPSGGTDEN